MPKSELVWFSDFQLLFGAILVWTKSSGSNNLNPNYDLFEWSIVRISAFTRFRTFDFRHSTVHSFKNPNKPNFFLNIDHLSMVSLVYYFNQLQQQHFKLTFLINSRFLPLRSGFESSHLSFERICYASAPTLRYTLAFRPKNKPSIIIAQA